MSKFLVEMALLPDRMSLVGNPEKDNDYCCLHCSHQNISNTIKNLGEQTPATKANNQ